MNEKVTESREVLQKEEKVRRDKEAEEEEVRLAVHDGTSIVCGCCFSSVPAAWIFQCNVGHKFCKKCLLTAAEAAIGEGKDSLSCLNMGNCEEKLDLENLRNVLPEKTLQRLIESQFLNAVSLVHDDRISICHFCSRRVISEEQQIFLCPDCHKETCKSCGKKSHENKTCAEAGQEEVDAATESIVRECPSCKTRFLKEEGCNKMTCPRCHSIICYMCRKILPPEVGYSHFYRGDGPAPFGSCPLFVDTKILHQLEMIQAAEEVK